MINKEFELERLRSSLRGRGLDENVISMLVDKAGREIDDVMAERMSAAMDAAIQAGVDKNSSDFINNLRPKPGAFQLETASGETDFTTPPFPMLPRLLAGAKPIADGSGVYKVIPVGKPGNKPPIAANIFDAQKAISAERMESAKRQYNKVAPNGSKQEYRTATSKQSEATQWVQPPKEADFTADMLDINKGLEQDLQDVVLDIIRDYEENF